MGVIGLAAAGAVNFTNAMMRNDFAAASNSLLGSAKGVAMEAIKRMGSEFVGGVQGLTPKQLLDLQIKHLVRRLTHIWKLYLRK